MTDPVVHQVLFYDYVENAVERRAPFREEHLAWARAWKDDGRLVMAGGSARCSGMPGRDLTVDGDPGCVPLARDRSPAGVRHGSGARKTRRTCGRVH